MKDNELKKAIQDLSDGLQDAGSARLERNLLETKDLLAAVGRDEYEHIVAATERLVLMRQLDAIANLVLEVAIDESQGYLMCTDVDEEDGFGQFPHLAALSRILESGGDSGDLSHVGDRFLERLLVCLHDDTSDLNGNPGSNAGRKPSSKETE